MLHMSYVSHMKLVLLLQVEGIFYVNDPLEKLIFEELRNACRGGGPPLSESLKSSSSGV